MLFFFYFNGISITLNCHQIENRCHINGARCVSECPERIKEIGVYRCISQSAGLNWVDRQHARERWRAERRRQSAEGCARSRRTHARTHARACRSRIFSRPAASRPAYTHTRRRFVITAGSHGRICIFPRWLSVRQRRHLHPTRHDSTRRERNRVRSRSASECKTRAHARWIMGCGNTHFLVIESHAYRRVSSGRRDRSAVSHQHPASSPSLVVSLSIFLSKTQRCIARIRACPIIIRRTIR